MTQVCCGTTCDKALMELELKLEGAYEFLEYLEEHITEDCSKKALMLLLLGYARTLK